MPTYAFDHGGQSYEFDTPTTLTPEQIIAAAPQVIAQHQAQVAAAAKAHEGKTGFWNALAGSGKEALASTLKAYGTLADSPDALTAAENWKKKAAATFEPTTEEDQANAKGILPTAGAWLERKVLEPVAGMVGAYAAPTLGAAAAGFLAPEVAAGAGAVGLVARAVPYLARAFGAAAVGTGAEVGRNIERREEKNPGQPIDKPAAVVAGLLQSAMVGIGIPGTGAGIKFAAKAFGKPAEEIAAKVLSGQLKTVEGQAMLNGFAKNYMESMASNTVAGAGMMVGTEALRRGQAGQEVLSPEAFKEYGSQAVTAAELSPIMGLLHAPFKRGAEMKQLEAAGVKGEEQRQQLNQDLMGGPAAGQQTIGSNWWQDATNKQVKSRAAELEQNIANAKAVDARKITDPDEKAAFIQQVQEWRAELNQIKMGGEEMPAQDVATMEKAAAAITPDKMAEAGLAGDPQTIIATALAAAKQKQEAQAAEQALKATTDTAKQAEQAALLQAHKDVIASISTPEGLASARTKLAQMQEDLQAAKAVDPTRIVDPVKRAAWIADLQQQRADINGLKKILPTEPPKPKAGEAPKTEPPPLDGTVEEIRARALQEEADRQAAALAQILKSHDEVRATELAKGKEKLTQQNEKRLSEEAAAQQKIADDAAKAAKKAADDLVAARAKQTQVGLELPGSMTIPGIKAEIARLEGLDPKANKDAIKALNEKLALAEDFSLDGGAAPKVVEKAAPAPKVEKPVLIAGTTPELATDAQLARVARVNRGGVPVPSALAAKAEIERRAAEKAKTTPTEEVAASKPLEEKVEPVVENKPAEPVIEAKPEVIKEEKPSVAETPKTVKAEPPKAETPAAEVSAWKKGVSGFDENHSRKGEKVSFTDEAGKPTEGEIDYLFKSPEGEEWASLNTKSGEGFRLPARELSKPSEAVKPAAKPKAAKKAVEPTEQEAITAKLKADQARELEMENQQRYEKLMAAKGKDITMQAAAMTSEQATDALARWKASPGGTEGTKTPHEAALQRKINAGKAKAEKPAAEKKPRAKKEKAVKPEDAAVKEAAKKARGKGKGEDEDVAKSNQAHDPASYFNKVRKSVAEAHKLDPESKEAHFAAIGDMQRAAPEVAMLDIQRSEFARKNTDGNTYGNAAEHIGDLTWRLTEMYKWGDDPRHVQLQEVLNKVDKALSWISPKVAAAAKDPAMRDLTRTYAKAHSEIPVFNRVQELARQAAVAWGHGNFAITKDHLLSLKSAIEKDLEGTRKEAHSFDKNYEKGTEASRTTGETTTSTRESVTTALKEHFDVHQAGRFDQRVKIYESLKDVPAQFRSKLDNTTQGFVYKGTVHLIADKITKGHEMSVLLHELGVHVGMEKNDSKWLGDRIAKWAEMDNGTLESRIAKRAMDRIPADTKAHLTHEERVGYFLEEARKEGLTPQDMAKKPGLLGNWYRNFLSAFHKAMVKIGLRREPTAQDLVDFAYGLAHKSLEADRPMEQKELAFSKQAPMSPAFAAGRDMFEYGERPSIKDFAKKEFAKGKALDFRARYVDHWAHSLYLAEEAVKAKVMSAKESLQMWTNLSFVDSLPSLVYNSINKGITQLVKGEDGVHMWMNKDSKANLVNIHKLVKDNVEDYETFRRMVNGTKVGFDKAGVPLDKVAEAKRLAPQIIAEGMKNPAFREAHALEVQMNKDIIKMLTDSGRLSKEEAATWSPETYSPSYDVRVNGDVYLDGGGAKPYRVGNIKDMPEIKHLLGGEKKLLSYWDARARNIEIMNRLAVTNYATKSIAYMLRDLGLGIVSKPGGDPHSSVNFYEHGNLLSVRADKDAGIERAQQLLRKAKSPQQREQAQRMLKFFDESNYISLPNLVANMAGTAMITPKALKWAAAPARVLHAFITRNPFYALKQFPRDLANAYVLNGGDKATLPGIFKRLKDVAFKSDKNADYLEMTGAGEGNILRNVHGDFDRQLSKMYSQGTGMKGVWNQMKYMADVWATAGDMTVRSALFETSKKSGMTDAEARKYAIEAGTNFKTRGSSATMYWANMLTPFVNSQMRGLDVSIRAVRGMAEGQEKTQAFQKLLVRGTLLATSALVYHTLVSDEDWYQGLTPEDRANNIHLMFPGFKEPMRFALPFETGTMFVALPQIMATLFKDANGLGWNDFAKMLRTQMLNNVPGGGVALGEYGFAPTLGLPGTLAKGLLGWFSNTDMQTGNKIVSDRIGKLEKGEQFTDKTTAFAKEAGAALGLSPLQVDAFARSFVSTMGMAIAHTLTEAVTSDRPGVSKPDALDHESKIYGTFFAPVDGHHVVDALYDKFFNKPTEATDTLRDIQKRQLDPEKAIAYAKEHAVALSLAKNPGLQSLKKHITETTTLIRTIPNMPDKVMDPAKKREMIDKLNQNMIQYGKQLAKLDAMLTAAKQQQP